MEEKPEPTEEKTKTTSDTKSQNPLMFFTRTENQILKNGKSAINTKTEKKTDLKDSQNCETENPNVPLLKESPSKVTAVQQILCNPRLLLYRS